MLSFFPLPNRAPEGAGEQILQNINNYRREDIQQFRRNNVDDRLDFKFGKHSLYASFGITRGQITTPRTLGADNPFYAQNSFIGNLNNDDNPYIQIGDTVVLAIRQCSTFATASIASTRITRLIRSLISTMHHSAFRRTCCH